MTEDLQKLGEEPDDANRRDEHGADRLLVTALLFGLVILFATNTIAWLSVNAEIRAHRQYIYDRDLVWATTLDWPVPPAPGEERPERPK